jgi:hypothetical protein
VLLVGLALVWALGCVGVAWWYPRSIARLGLGPWSAELGEALEDARSDAERVAIANQALAEAEHALVQREGVPAAAGWLVLGGCALAAVAGLLVEPALALVLVVGAAAGGVGGCALASRVGRERARRCRARLDAAVHERVGALYDAEVELPRRRSLRRRRRRG